MKAGRGEAHTFFIATVCLMPYQRDRPNPALWSKSTSILSLASSGCLLPVWHGSLCAPSDDRPADTCLVRCGNATDTVRSNIGGGADLLCDRRRAGTSHLGTARPDPVDESRNYAVEGRRMPKELTPSGHPPEEI